MMMVMLMMLCRVLTYFMKITSLVGGQVFVCLRPLRASVSKFSLFFFALYLNIFKKNCFEHKNMAKDNLYRLRSWNYYFSLLLKSITFFVALNYYICVQFYTLWLINKGEQLWFQLAKNVTQIIPPVIFVPQTVPFLEGCCMLICNFKRGKFAVFGTSKSVF